MQPHQTVSEMAEEILEGQAKALADETEQSTESAMEVEADTQAGRLLRELRDGPRGHEKARDWQTDLSWGRAEERLMHLVGADALARPSPARGYSWVGDYLGRLEGKEAREEYYAALERLTIYD